MISSLLIINGIYDILCAFSILGVSFPLSTYLSELHPEMIRDDCSDNPVTRRILAYWIFTYGVIRLIAGIYPREDYFVVASVTYFIEAFALEYESYLGYARYPIQIHFVSLFSIILGFLTINKNITNFMKK